MTRSLLVKHLMTPEVVTLNLNDELRAADDIMRLGRIRHLPVIDDAGRLVGLLSQRDLFHSGVMRALGYGVHGQRKLMELLSIKEAMKTDVVTTTPDTPLTDAAYTMLVNKLGCLPVLEGDKLVGILTEGDFVALAAGEKPIAPSEET